MSPLKSSYKKLMEKKFFSSQESLCCVFSMKKNVLRIRIFSVEFERKFIRAERNKR